MTDDASLVDFLSERHLRYTLHTTPYMYILVCTELVSPSRVFCDQPSNSCPLSQNNSKPDPHNYPPDASTNASARWLVALVLISWSWRQPTSTLRLPRVISYQSLRTIVSAQGPLLAFSALQAAII